MAKKKTTHTIPPLPWFSTKGDSLHPQGISDIWRCGWDWGGGMLLASGGQGRHSTFYSPQDASPNQG